MKQWMNDRLAQARVFLRERKERAAERKAQAAKHINTDGAPLIWIWFLAVIAAATLTGSTWMLVVFIAGSVGHVDWALDWRAGNDGQPSKWVWFAEANLHALIGLGLGFFVLGIAAFNAVWLHVRTHLFGMFRNVITVLGALVALFMVSGAIVVQQWGTVARERDEIVATNTARAGEAAVQAEIDAIETEMARLCAPNLTTWQAQACRSGEQAWGERIATAHQQNDGQINIIERAMADARQGDRWRARLLELRQQHALAAVTTVQAEAQQVEATGWMTTFARFLEDLRKPFVAVLGELLAMTMFGVALAAWRSRFKTHEQSGWAPEDHRIEDLRADEAVTPQPMKPPREVVRDAETGEELIKITPKPHWRKRKGKVEQLETQRESMNVEYEGRTFTTRGADVDDASRAIDTSGREAVSVAQHSDDEAREEDSAQAAADGQDHLKGDNSDLADLTVAHTEPPSQDKDYLDALSGTLPEAPQEPVAEANAADEQEPSAPQADDDASEEAPEPVAADQDDAFVDHREPETDPRRLIAAE